MPVKLNVASQFGHVQSVITINWAISRLQSVSLTLQINRIHYKMSLTKTNIDSLTQHIKYFR